MICHLYVLCISWIDKGKNNLHHITKCNSPPPKKQSKWIKGANGYKTKWVEHYGVTSLRRTMY